MSTLKKNKSEKKGLSTKPAKKSVAKIVHEPEVKYSLQPALKKAVKRPINIESIASWTEIDAFIDKLIDLGKMEISSLDFHLEQDLMLIVLNNGTVINQKISNYPLLSKGNEKQLKKYKFYAGKTAVEWEGLDEDLSLRGFLKEDILKSYIPGWVN
jgi:Protein of unknown function (DUF2442)